MTARTEAHHLLDPSAFVAALVLAPVLVTALTFMLLVPIFALFYGVLPYLIFGTPVFLWMVTRHPVRFGTFALGGLVAHALFVGCFALWANANPGLEGQMLNFFALWGVPFAMVWGGTFGWLYRSFYRSPVRHFVH